jgi:GNAT superfamily N-acetyltransferase
MVASLTDSSVMDVVASCSVVRPVDDLRCVAHGDEPALGRLLYRAYLNAVDYEGETPDESETEVRNTLGGAYGRFVPDWSFVVVRDTDAAAATLVTLWQGRPLIAYTATDPRFQRQGLARACMLASMNAMLRAGETEVWLAVTLANEPARALFESLGFTIGDR